MERIIKVIIADDHRLVRQGFRALLEGMDFIEVIGEAADGQQVIQLLRNGKLAEVILMDIEMPNLSGIEATEQIARDFFGVKVIILTMLNDRAIIQQAIDKGAKGFLFKNATTIELSEAIRRVAAGEIYLGSEVALTLLQKSEFTQNQALSQLSERELQVLKLIAEGYSSTEIGTKLFISPRTVDTHRNNLIHKLQVNGIAGLVKFALQHKMI
jgi:DNA-binding NarL/FixJ family response regulator